MENRKRETKKSIWRYSRYLLKDSQVSGISQITETEGNCRKAMKLIILSVSIAGFLYQGLEFLNHYWEYSTITSEKNLETMMKPAFTICDSNLLYRTEYCNLPLEEEIGCVSAESNEDLCQIVPSYCKSSKISGVPLYKISLDYQFDPRLFNISFTRQYGTKIYKRMEDCNWHIPDSIDGNIMEIPCGEPKFVRGASEIKIPAACWAFDSQIGQKVSKPNYFTYDSSLTLTIVWYNYDTIDIDPSIKRSLFLCFHDPAQICNPFNGNLEFYQNKEYQVHIQEVEERRLAFPYKTMCKDYFRDWEANRGKGPLNARDCQKMCEITLQLKKYKCVFQEVAYPHEEEICPKLLPLDVQLEKEIQVCSKECRDACREHKYIAKKEIVAKLSDEENIERYKTDTVVQIDVRFDVSESKRFTAIPRYESAELIGYIGGYLGMWLGWSLIAILDLFETVLYLFKYLFLKKGCKMKSGIFHCPSKCCNY